jgi:membrane fusion protein, macrolide-specific efflux system
MNISKKINNRYFSTFKIIIALLLVCSLVLSLTGCFLLPEGEVILASPVQLKEPQHIDINTETAKRDNITNKIIFWGEFLSPERYDLQFSNIGRLKNIFVSINDYVNEGEVVAELEGNDLETQFENLQINLQKAQLNYDKAKAESDISGGDKYQIEDAKLSLDLAKSQMDNVKQKIEKTKIIAPVSGIISYIYPVEIGDNVKLHKTFMTITNKNKVTLVAKYVKGGMDSCSVGMKVKVTYNSRDYTGQIIKAPLDQVNEKIENFKNAFIIKVDGLNTNSVTLNDTAQVECILAQVTNVIVTKKAYIIEDNDKKKFVYIFENGAIIERQIETGIDDGTRVEIKKGVTEGEAIVIQ